MLPSKHHKDIVNSNYSEILGLYKKGESFTEIAKKFSTDRKAVAKKLKEEPDLNIRGQGSYSRKYNLNEHYFDIVDTEDKAYMLGFIYADGNNLFSQNRISIKLAKRDEDILKKFSSIMYYDQTVLNYLKLKNKKGKEFEYVSLNFFSEHLSQQMNKLGVYEAKSYKITYPEWLDENLHKHFIRGLIDGDGWIYLPKSNRDSPNVGLICTRQINEYIKSMFESKLGLKSYFAKAHKQDPNVMCEIRVKNYHQCKIILDWLYKDATIYLNRKYNLYLDFLDRYENLRNQSK